MVRDGGIADWLNRKVRKAEPAGTGKKLNSGEADVEIKCLDTGVGSKSGIKSF